MPNYSFGKLSMRSEVLFAKYANIELPLSYPERSFSPSSMRKEKTSGVAEVFIFSCLCNCFSSQSDLRTNRKCIVAELAPHPHRSGSTTQVYSVFKTGPFYTWFSTPYISNKTSYSSWVDNFYFNSRNY